MTAFHTSIDVPKFLLRHLFLILILLWTPLFLFQTWNVQHSCSPLVNWGGDRCPIEEVVIQGARDLTVKPGKSQKLKVDALVKTSVKNTDSMDRGVQWTSSDDKVAQVNDLGQVVAVAPGKVEITAISHKDKAKKDTIKMTVEGISSVEVQPKNLKIEVGESRRLEAKVNGFGNFSDSVSWSSSNNQIATIDSSGLIKGIAEGEATIQATAKQDSHQIKTIKATVYQTVKIEKLTINNEDELTSDFRVGELRPITVTVEGIGANSNDITWSSSNPEVLAVHGQGHEVQLEAKSADNVIITATSNQDKSKKVTARLKILQPLVTSVSVRPENLELDTRSKAKLCLAVEGKGSIDTTVNWSSSDDQIATVDSDGIVTPQSAGTVKIRATSNQTPTKFATSTVKIIPQETNWLAIGLGAMITAGATAIGVPLPAAMALGSAAAIGMQVGHETIPSSCG